GQGGVGPHDVLVFSPGRGLQKGVFLAGEVVHHRPGFPWGVPTRTPRSVPWRCRCCTAAAAVSAPFTPTTSPLTSRSLARRSTSCTRGCCCSTCPSASPY